MLVHNPVQEMVLPIILLADHRNVLVGKFVVMEVAEIVLVMMVRIAQKIRVLLLHVHVVRHLVVFSLHVVHMIKFIKNAVSLGNIAIFRGDSLIFCFYSSTVGVLYGLLYNVSSSFKIFMTFSLFIE